MFKVGDHEYQITYACLELFGRLQTDAVCWGVKILGKSPGGSDDMSRWEPAIIADVLLETKPGEKSHWYEIAGTTIAWDEPNEDPQALFEVWGTTAIYSCKWQFVAQNQGVRLLFEGMTDIDTDFERIPICVDTPLKVAPFPMGKRPENECHERFRSLGFEDPVEFRIMGKAVSSLVFLDQ